MKLVSADKQITCWVGKQLETELNTYCAVNKLTVSFVLRSAIVSYLQTRTKPAARAGSKPVPLVELDWS